MKRALLSPFLLTNRNRYLPKGKFPARTLGLLLFAFAVCLACYFLTVKVVHYFHSQNELGIILSLAADFYIDYWRKHFPHIELYGYSGLFAAGFIAGMIGVYFISTIPEPRMVHVEGKAHFFGLILKPMMLWP